MRTTVDIPDPIYRKLKTKAAEQGCSVKELILHGVEKELQGESPNTNRIRLPLVKSREPGKLRITNEQIYEIIPFP